MKNILNKFLSVALAITIIFISALVGLNELDFAGNENYNPFTVKTKAASESDLTFTLNSDGESYSVTDCNESASGELVIPSTYNGKPVTGISDYAFAFCASLKSIKIPDEVKNIGEAVFFKCNSLASITIPDNVTGIGDMAFYECNSLTSISIPESVISIGDYSFAYCNNIQSLSISEGVTTIGNHAFYECDSLTSLTIPSSITNIGAHAFAYCDALKSVSISEGVTSIGDSVFYKCNSLTSITIPGSVTNIGDHAFAYCDALKSVSISEGVTIIGNYAFCECNSLTSITIPGSVTNIGDSAFANCNNLQSVSISEGVTTIGDYAFYNCRNIKTMLIPDSVIGIGTDAFYYCSISSSCSSYAAQYAKENKVNINIIHSLTGEWKTSKQVTCTDDGTKYQECLVCAERFYEIIPAFKPTEGHSWGNWQITAEPTCSDFGEQIRKCNDCDYTETEQIAKVPHTLEKEWVIEKEATCENDGVTVLYCSGCKKQMQSSAIPATGHKYGEKYNVSSSTCSVQGGYSHKCIICDKEETVKLPLIDHSFDDFEIVAEPTCSQEGSKKHICSSCGYTEYVSIETASHKYVIESENVAVCSVCKNTKSFDFIITTDETITLTYTARKEFEFMSSDSSVAIITSASNSVISSGSYYNQTTKATFTPVKPGEFIAKIVDVNGNVLNTSSLLVVEGEHKFVFYENCENATCQETGVDLYKCKFCEEEKLVDSPKLNHEFGEWFVSLSPTCTEKGEKYHICSVCGEKEYSEILEKEHVYVIDAAVEPTCKDAGKTEGCHCSICNEVFTAQISVAPKGHSPSPWIIDEEATANTAGSKHKECTVCGETVETGKIAQLKCDKPSLKKIENTADGVKLTWDKVEGADKYEIYCRKGSKGKYTKLGTTCKNYVTHKKAKSGNKYYYYVVAVNEVGSSEASKAKSIYYLADPTLKTPKSTKSGIVLKWNKITGADGYMVYRKTGSGSYSKIATVKGNSKVTYTDKKAKKGKTYTYKVKAYKSKTSSAYSNAKKIKDKF